MAGLINIDPTAVTNLVGGVINRIWPDKTAEQQQSLDHEFELLKGQLAVNAVEASSTNWFVAGWRPAVGWVGVGGLLWQFVLFPCLALAGVKIPAIDISALYSLLVPMLGIGALRTIEKVQNAEGNR